MEQGFEQNTPLMVLGFWLVGCFLFAKLSGWSQLAIHYRSQGRFAGRRFPMQSVRMRWMLNYGNCVTLGANDTGLYVAMLFLFRPFHPPLFIPWEELSVNSTVNPFGLRFVSLQPKGVPGISLAVSEALAGQLQHAEDLEEEEKTTGLTEQKTEGAEWPTPAASAEPPLDSAPPLAFENVAKTERRRKAEIAAHLDQVLQQQRDASMGKRRPEP